MRHFDPRSIAGLLFWQRDITPPYAFPGHTFVDGDKTICYIFKLNNVPGAGTFVSLGQLYSATPLGTEVFLSAIGAPYLAYSVAVDTLATTSSGNATVLDTNQHSLVLRVASGVNMMYLDGASLPLSASGPIGLDSSQYSSTLGGREVTAGSVPQNVIDGTMKHAFAYDHAVTAAELAMLNAWNSKQ